VIQPLAEPLLTCRAAVLLFRGGSTDHLGVLVHGLVEDREVGVEAYEGLWPSRLSLSRARVRLVELAFGAEGARRTSRRCGWASPPTCTPGRRRRRRSLEEAFAHLRAFAPDVLILGGDYVLFEAAHADELAPLIRSVGAPLGRYAILGNHDLWADDRAIARSLECAEATLLVNRCVSFSRRPEVSLSGLDDAWAGIPDYEAAFGGGVGQPVHVVAMHSPDHVPRLAGRRFTLAVCGHTHGGQIALPGPRALHAPSEESRRYLAGRYDLPGGPLWVSRGVGHAEVPWRWFAPADVLSATLRR
jgi:predicted MPP superfamily phosphohydrolase